MAQAAAPTATVRAARCAPDCSATPCARTARCASGRATTSTPADTCPDATPWPARPICVPVRMLGEAVGVIHRAGTVRSPATELDVSYVESLAGRVEARLSCCVSPVRRARPPLSTTTTGVYTQATLEEDRGAAPTPSPPTRWAAARSTASSTTSTRHGDDAADDALRTLGRAAQRCMRPADVLGRARLRRAARRLFPATRAIDARRALERIREELVLELTARDAAPRSPSPSGWWRPASASRSTTVLEQVDDATALAKHLGGNRVVLAGEAPEESERHIRLTGPGCRRPDRRCPRAPPPSPARSTGGDSASVDRRSVVGCLPRRSASALTAISAIVERTGSAPRHVTEAGGERRARSSDRS